MLRIRQRTSKEWLVNTDPGSDIQRHSKGRSKPYSAEFSTPGRLNHLV